MCATSWFSVSFARGKANETSKIGFPVDLESGGSFLVLEAFDRTLKPCSAVRPTLSEYRLKSCICERALKEEVSLRGNQRNVCETSSKPSQLLKAKWRGILLLNRTNSFRGGFMPLPDHQRKVKASPQDARGLAPDVPWEKIIGTRNVLVHGYLP